MLQPYCVLQSLLQYNYRLLAEAIISAVYAVVLHWDLSIRTEFEEFEVFICVNISSSICWVIFHSLAVAALSGSYASVVAVEFLEEIFCSLVSTRKKKWRWARKKD